MTDEIKTFEKSENYSFHYPKWLNWNPFFFLELSLNSQISRKSAQNSDSSRLKQSNDTDRLKNADRSWYMNIEIVDTVGSFGSITWLMRNAWRRIRNQ